MPKESKRLEVGNEVLIPSLNMYGKVVHVSPPAENPDDGYCKVQILHYFRRSDLELYDLELEREKRDSILEKKRTKWQASYEALQKFFAQGGDASSADAASLGYKALTDATELWRELNHYASK